MLTNILVYIAVLIAVFLFHIFYAAWFSQFIFTVILLMPIVSLIASLPFMIMSAINGFTLICPRSVNINDNIYLGISHKAKRFQFVPFIKVTLKANNIFTKKYKKLTLKYGGNMSKSALINDNWITSNCGCIRFSTKYIKVYDFMGIFFIPVKVKFRANTIVLPKPMKPALLPDSDSSVIVGYKAKPGGGFSDFYELRQYQSGDSLKNIHWKLSSKQDELIVREPCEPIFNKLIIKIELTDDTKVNDFILGRLLYVCSYFIKTESVCYALENRSGTLNKIQCKKDLVQFLVNIYTGSSENTENCDFEGCVTYSILPDHEEVGTL